MEYHNFALDLGERTLKIIKQYHEIDGDLEEKYEVSLLINCLLGLVMLPKEKGQSYLPSKRVHELADWGIFKSKINGSKSKTVRELVEQLRGGVAHLSFDFKTDGNSQIEYVLVFDDNKVEVLAEFHVAELHPFLSNLYSEWRENYKKYSKH
jgi:hypothetical protein